jgi:8-oxo-dGTP pyrophosphatase MutT (NUDIX family)
MKRVKPSALLKKIQGKLNMRGGEDAKAAVAIIFRNNKGVLELLLVKRAIVNGDPWSGDMAFPGGKKGEQDNTIIETVVREVMEETSIDLAQNKFLGMMNTVYSTVRPNMGILPLIYLQDEGKKIRINEELDSYHWVALDRFAKSRGWANVKGLDVPVFYLEGNIVWGLTYRMIDGLLKLFKEG